MAWYRGLPGDLERAAQILPSVPTEAGSSLLRAMLVGSHIRYAEARGTPADTLALALDAVDQARRAGNRWAAAHIFSTAVTGAVASFPPHELLVQIRPFMVDWRHANDRARLSRTLLFCAHGLHALGKVEFAARLLGSEAWTQPADHAVRQQLVERLQQKLAPEILETQSQQGRDTPLTQLADEAIRAIARLTPS